MSVRAQGYVALAVGAAVLALAATHDQPSAATGGVLVVALLVVVVLVALLRSRAGGRGGGRGRRVSIGHSHGGTSRIIARHEAGHVAVARAVGCTDITVEAWDGGGVTHAGAGGMDALSRVAIARGGQYATSSRRGCAGDDDIVRDALRGVPRDQRSQVRRDGEALGRQAVRRAGGQIRRDAVTIERTGRLG